MGLFDQLVKTAARAVTLPVSVAADVVSAFDIDDPGPLEDSKTMEHLKKLKDDALAIPDSVDED